ncbi:transposase [Candidatus Peregrinibacteria bacterium]|nr:transposase [Candidatus Peregrinibacteria bacterium]
MRTERPNVIRYSIAFKRHVVSEIESAAISIGAARRRYGIGGADTIQKWLRQFGKNHLLAKVVHVQTPEEKDQLKLLKNRVRDLEKALSDSHMKNVMYESLIEAANEHLDCDLKKKYGEKP